MITKANDTRANLADLVSNHQAMVWRYLRALGCDPALADDLTQETFLTLVKKPMEYRGEAAAAVYLRMVARSRFISLMRKNGREPNRVEIETVEAQWAKLVRDDGHDEGEEALSALQLCIAKLPEEARKAVRMRYADKVSRVETAEALELSPDGVKSLLRRARKALRLCIEKKLEQVI